MATDNNKVIALIRTSTTAQEVESQREELIEYITADGINPDNIIVVGGAGASAIKVDESYQRNINEVYRLIEQGNVSTVYAWAIDRIGRNEEVLMHFKNRLIENKVQLVIKNPSLRLLNPDGTVNSGIELAFSLFATMAKQEMEAKKARFARAKKRNTEAGRYNGGRVPFGYTVDENGKITICPQDAETVRLMFRLYDTGEYSTSALAKEINARGIKVGRNALTTLRVNQILRNPAYIGHVGSKPYPRIVGDTLFNAVGERMSANRKGAVTTQSKRINLCSKLIVCPQCGSHFFAASKTYKCLNARPIVEHRCDNREEMSIEWLDVVALHVAKMCEVDYIFDNTAAKAQEAQAQIEVNHQKIKTLRERIAKASERRERIAEMYIEGAIDKATQTKQMTKIKTDTAAYNAEVVELEEANNRLAFFTTETDDYICVRMGRIAVSGINENKEEAYRMTHRHLKRITFHGDKKEKLITVTTVLGDVHRYIYRPKSKLTRYGKPIRLWEEVDGEFQPLFAFPEFVPCELE